MTPEQNSHLQRALQHVIGITDLVGTRIKQRESGETPHPLPLDVSIAKAMACVIEEIKLVATIEAALHLAAAAAVTKKKPLW